MYKAPQALTSLAAPGALSAVAQVLARAAPLAAAAMSRSGLAAAAARDGQWVAAGPATPPAAHAARRSCHTTHQLASAAPARPAEQEPWSPHADPHRLLQPSRVGVPASVLSALAERFASPDAAAVAASVRKLSPDRQRALFDHVDDVAVCLQVRLVGRGPAGALRRRALRPRLP